MNNFGLSTARRLIGVTVLMIAAFTFHVIIKEKKEYLHVTGMIALSWTIGRLISLFVDGFHDSTLSGIFLSFGMFVFIVISFQLWEKTEKQS